MASFKERRTCPRDGVPTRVDIGDPLVGAVLGERYKVLDRVASGGMGHVYRAAHTRMASIFAVKVLYGDLAYDAAMRVRFEREAEVASLLQSRYIVRVVDFSQSDSGLLYLAMEYLDGATLAELVRRAGRLDPRRATDLVIQMARGLAHAHERGIVHRDLKADNVIVVDEDDADVAKILDFGVARLRREGRDTDGSVAGTPAYMAPEQFAGGDVDARADLYALGVTFFELLTGRVPFSSESSIDLIRRHLTEPPPSLVHELGPSALVVAVDELVQRLLAKKRDDRFASARDFVSAARAALEGGARAPVSVRASHAPAPPAPTVDGTVVAGIRRAVMAGAPTYNAGDHAGCFAIYRATVERALSQNPVIGLAERARLEVALSQSLSAPGPTLAAWTLRHAFDELETATPVSRFAARDALDATIDVFFAIVGRGYAMGHASALAPFHFAFGQHLRHALGTTTRKAELTALERALDAAGRSSPDEGAGILSEALEKLRDPAHTATTSRSVSLAPTAVGPPAARVPDIVRQAILRAIKAGVPAYNRGDIEGCSREYLRTADAIVGEARRAPESHLLASWLGPVTERARDASPHDAAWILRHAFDALLALP